MKKLKLLSSLSALVLVLSLGACNNNKGDDVTSDDVDSSETTPTVEDVTLSFSFVDATGAASTIPEYATAYVIGSWDGWSQFIPLTEKDGAYSTKFNELEIGSLTYKVVEWYTGESVSWSDCVEITTTDQTLTIKEEDANSTISVTHTLSAVLDKLGVLEGEEAIAIALAILEEIPEETWLDEYTWDTIHVEEEDPDYFGESQSIFLNRTIESFYGIFDYEVLYGVALYQDEDGSTYSFYKDQLLYEVDVDTNGEIDDIDTGSTYDDFEELVSDFSDPLLDASGLAEVIDPEQESEDEATMTVTRNLHSYEVVISIEDWGTYTYNATHDYVLTGFAYDDGDGYKFSVEETTLDVIDYKMNEYKSLIGVCLEPADFLAKAAKESNYMVTLYYEDLLSTESVTYGEYNAAVDKYYEGDRSEYNEIMSTLEESLALTDYWVLQIFYTEDAILIEYYEEFILYGNDFGGPYYVGSELIVNSEIDGEDVFYDFWSEDREEAEWDLGIYDEDGNYLYDAIYEGSWQDYYWSLADAYEAGVADGFDYYGYGSDYGFTAWLLDDYDLAETFFKCLGGQFLFGNTYNDYYASLMYHYMTYAFPSYGEIDTDFYYSGFSYYTKDLVDGELADTTPLYYHYMEVYAEITDFGGIDLTEEIATAFATSTEGE